MRPSFVRSNTAPHASSSRTRSGRFLGVQLGHAPVVQVLAAAHRVGEVHRQLSRSSTLRHRRRHAALGHDGVRLAEQRLVMTATFTPCATLRWPARSPRRRRQSRGRRVDTSGD
jgi:hypothetical protein